MLIPFGDVGSTGIIKDSADYLLPIGAWTEGRNVRFRDGSVARMGGAAATLDPPAVAPYWLMLMFVPETGRPGIVYMGAQSGYCFIADGHQDITRLSGPYTGFRWTGGLLGGLPILSNGADVPQAWLDPKVGTRLADLPNWPSTWRCKIIRPYRSFLVALNMIEESIIAYPHRLRWSHPAQPGGIPISWDDTDESRDAGITELPDAVAGEITDATVLRDVLLVYKERSTWGLQFTGGEFKMRLFQIFESVGAMSMHCATAFGNGGMHFVATGEDLIIHDGQQLKSILGGKLRRWLQGNLSTQWAKRSFVVPVNKSEECWFCFPTSGVEWPNMALVWRQRENTIAIRELGSAAYITPLLVPGTSKTWDSDHRTWDEMKEPWDALQGGTDIREATQADPLLSKIWRLEGAYTFGDNPYPAQVERTGLSLVGLNRNGNPVSDPEQLKLVRSIYPRCEGGALAVRVGRQDLPGGPIEWGLDHTFSPGVGQKVDVLDDLKGACRLFGIRFTWQGSTSAELRGFDVDVEPVGLF